MTARGVAWLFGRQRFGIRPGLDRVRGLLRDVGDPQEAFATVLVGGTNGKGTTATALAACLKLGGAGPVGCFTSPHLQHVTERFAIDGRPVPLDALEDALEGVRPFAERRDATFFEIATAVAARLFADAGTRAAVFEVGLGGRWDATNVLEPVQSIVTGVALDHTDVLGTDLEGIARDKAGILRRGVPSLTGATGVAGAAIAARAAELGAPLWRVGEEIRVEGRGLGWDGQALEIATPAGAVRTSTRLLGAHQRRNLALAAAGALRAGVPPEAVEAALPTVRWPGRLERFVRLGRTVVLDGAHNPEAAAALVAAMEELGATPYTLVAGVGADKDVPAVVARLAARASAVVATRARHSPRASAPSDVAGHAARTAPVAASADDPSAALATALSIAPEGGTVLVAGSLYLVGEVRSILEGAAPEPWPRLQ